MERQPVAKPSTSETKTNNNRLLSYSHEPDFPIGGRFHLGKNLTDQPKLHQAKLRAKLEVSQPDDPYEQEADKVADKIMRIPAPFASLIDFSKIPIFPDQVQRSCSNSCDQNIGFNSSGFSIYGTLQPRRTAEDQTVQKSVKPSFLQAKLRIGQPNDIYEQEADRVADQVMRMPDPVIQRKCTKCDEDEEKVLQSKELLGHGPVTQDQYVPPIVHEVLQSPGQPLNPATRAYMEPRFGHDFSHVRVHTDAKAAESAKAVNSLAFTVGKDIVFGSGEYAPSSYGGRRLLAHELTHTIQQNAANHTMGKIRQDGETYEREIGVNACITLHRATVSVQSMSCELGIQRQQETTTSAETEEKYWLGIKKKSTLGADVNQQWIYEYDGCSMPEELGMFFPDLHSRNNPAGGVDTAFSNSNRTGACDKHDECYQTCGRKKNECDHLFYVDMVNTCNQSSADASTKQRCLKWAEYYYSGVSVEGGKPFDKRQSQVCKFKPAETPSRYRR